MSLYEDFQEWQEKLNALKQEGEELSRRIEEMEHQNFLLQQRMTGEDYRGFDALGSLYDDGFHICPANFGQSRDEDCLFCLNFLLHKGKKE